MTLSDEVAALNWYRVAIVDRVIDARERSGHPMSDAELKSLCADINDLTKGWERAATSGKAASAPSTELWPPLGHLLTDSEWGSVDGDACRVFQFSPFGWPEEGRICTPKRVPYAAIHFECTRVSGTIKGYIIHKLDFPHLWQAFIERGVRDDEEVIAY